MVNPTLTSGIRCATCQAVTNAGKPTTCPECPERIREERDRYRTALEELAANRHGFHRPAGQIAREALDG